MVVSSVQGEGKTTLAGQLASSLARVHRRTLLIDGDLRSPSLHQFFDQEPGPGFSELLSRSARPSEGVRPTNVEGLDFLPAGTLTDAAEAGLANKSFVRGLLDELRANYEFVVVDSSPILLVPDALMLAEAVDGLLLSVRPGVSEVGPVQTAFERLHEHHLPVLGAILNGVKPTSSESPYKAKGTYTKPIVLSTGADTA
jgi:capsular exopolysaccharide synthesis family protein